MLNILINILTLVSKVIKKFQKLVQNLKVKQQIKTGKNGKNFLQ